MKLRILFLFLFGLGLPAWAQSGAVFTGETNGQTDLYRLDLKTLSIQPLIQHTADDSMPDVSPDGRQLAFVSTRGGANSLYLTELSGQGQEPVNISPGMGAYANPAFAPDGRLIAVSYSPDPELPFQNSTLVLLDPASRTQKLVVDSTFLRTGTDSASIFVVDRPKWIDAETLVFVGIEYGDPEFMRVISSALYRVSLKENQPVHLAGGESYFDEEGRPMGYRASMPVFRGGFISFIAIEGLFNRTAMFMPPDGSKKSPLPLRDGELFGPAIPITGGFLYGAQDSNGNFELRVYAEKDKKTEKVPFAGSAREPVLIP